MAVRYVKIPVFCAETGYTPKAVQRKIEDGVWKAGQQYKKAPDGETLIDCERYLEKTPRPPRIKREPLAGHIYFVQTAVSKSIKIGFSTKPDSRIEGLKTASPEPLEILVIINGTLALERKLHAKFAAHRLIREWFHPAPEIVAFIREVAES